MTGSGIKVKKWGERVTTGEGRRRQVRREDRCYVLTHLTRRRCGKVWLLAPLPVTPFPLTLLTPLYQEVTENMRSASYFSSFSYCSVFCCSFYSSSLFFSSYFSSSLPRMIVVTCFLFLSSSSSVFPLYFSLCLTLNFVLNPWQRLRFLVLLLVLLPPLLTLPLSSLLYRPPFFSPLVSP